jgi:uncharacterized lipoprotein NlpE involved in copper resistance
VQAAYRRTRVHRHPLLHNRRVHRIARLHWTLACAVATLVCACGDSARAPARAPDTFGSDAVLVWQGVVACADCAGIDTRLSLQQGRDASARYQLVEAFLDEGGAEYFREEGRWERSGTLLTLHARSGGVRRYRIADDGALVATDLGGGEAGQGHSLAPAAGVMPGM